MTAASRSRPGRRAFQFPIERAPEKPRAILGEMLRARRGDLGYPYRTEFRKATGIHEHLAGDIEKARRSNFPVEQLTNLARAYEVTYDSLLSVAWGNASHLESVAPAQPGARVLPFPPGDVTAQLGPRPAGVGLGAIPEALAILRALWRLASENHKPHPIPEDQATGEDLFGPGLNAESWDQLRNVDQLNWQDSIYSLAEVIAREKEMGLRSGSGGG